MRVTLIQPPNMQRTGKWKSQKVCRTPTNLALLAAYIRQHGHTPKIVDLDIEGGVADLDRSVQITDNFWQTRGLRGWGYIAAGRARDAAAELRAALELNRWNNWFGVGSDALGRRVGHSGGFPGISSVLDVYPDTGWTVVVLSNVDGGMPPVAQKLREVAGRLRRQYLTSQE